jgi:hypothetical protein
MSDEAANSLFESIVQNARDNAVSLTGGYRFNQLLNSILAVDASQPGQKAVFYNGESDEGVQNYKIAQDRIASNPQLYSIDQTPLGGILDEALDAYQDGALTSFEYSGLTTVAMAKYTLQTQGPVDAVVDGTPTPGWWQSTEVPMLIAKESQINQASSADIAKAYGSDGADGVTTLVSGGTPNVAPFTSIEAPPQSETLTFPGLLPVQEGFSFPPAPPPQEGLVFPTAPSTQGGLIPQAMPPMQEALIPPEEVVSGEFDIVRQAVLDGVFAMPGETPLGSGDAVFAAIPAAMLVAPGAVAAGAMTAVRWGIAGGAAAVLGAAPATAAEAEQAGGPTSPLDPTSVIAGDFTAFDANNITGLSGQLWFQGANGTPVQGTTTFTSNGLANGGGSTSFNTLPGADTSTVAWDTSTADVGNSSSAPADWPTYTPEAWPSDDGGDDGGQPVVLDLSGKGIDITQLTSSNIFMDMTGDGYQNRTAWAGAGDGVLAIDPTGSGAITTPMDFEFTQWDPTATSDMQALEDVFDTNHDGSLDAGDADWSEFGVLVTNADGTATFETMAELGITAINLTTDNTDDVLADGSSITGETTYTKTDGSTGTAADVTFAYDSNGYATQTTTTVNADGSTSIDVRALNGDGSLANETISTVSADGLTTTLRYDHTGDGLFDQTQTDVTVNNADSSQTVTISNFDVTGALSRGQDRHVQLHQIRLAARRRGDGVSGRHQPRQAGRQERQFEVARRAVGHQRAGGPGTGVLGAHRARSHPDAGGRQGGQSGAGHGGDGGDQDRAAPGDRISDVAAARVSA